MKLSDIFYFNKNDRLVGIWLIAIIACVVGIFALGNGNNDEELASAAKQEQAPRSDFKEGYYSKPNSNSNSNSKLSTENRIPKTEYHYFDLNTASPDELLDLGFTEREIHSIMNYRSKGGIYRRVEQMSKISGMTKGEYDRLAPYFYVSEEFRPASDFVKMPQRKRQYSSGGYNGGYSSGNYGSANPSSGNNGSAGNGGNSSVNGSKLSENAASAPGQRYESNKIKPGETIPINASDTTALKRIPGVGSTYAKMIVKYREKLGGFFSVEQLDDLEALPADIQEYLVLDPTPLRKIKVNSLSINRLIVHPYIKYYQAQAIREHIQKNGPLKSIRELALNKNFTDKDINRLEPYMDYE